jgi:hypothetical protein
MEHTALVLIVVTLFLLVIIVGLLTALVFKLLRQPPSVSTLPMGNDASAAADLSRSEFHPAILERMKELDKIKPRRAELFCPNHSEEPGEVTCSICDGLFCKACIKPFKNMHFCKEHLQLVMRHDWDEVITIKTSTADPEQGVRLFDVKKELFRKKDIPTYVETHYKINVDHDHIETYLVLFAIRESVGNLREHLKDFQV